MTDLIEFLRARYDEDEHAAQHAIDEWSDWDYAWHMMVQYNPMTGAKGASPTTSWVAVHADPARALAEVEAKRRIIEWHENWPILVDRPPEIETTGDSITDVTMRMTQQIAWMTEKEYRDRFGDEPPSGPVLQLLVLPYADHPDFDPAWRI